MGEIVTMKTARNFKRRSIFLKVFAGEIKTIFTDAGAILIFFLAMFVYPVLYTVAYQREIIRDLPVAVVDMDHSAASRKYARLLDATEQLQVSDKPASMQEAKALFYEGHVRGIILIPDRFERNIAAGIPNVVSAYCDASYFLLYKQVFAGATYANSAFSAQVEVNRMMIEGKTQAQAIESQNPLRTNVHNLYNPAGGYAHFVVPPILFIILQQTLLVGIGMLGGTIREKKQFMRYVAFAHKPRSTAELIFAKATAYVVVYILNSVLCLGLMYHFYDLPDKANAFILGLMLIPAFYAVSFLGMAISMFFKERIHAYIFLVFLSPAVVFMSGLSWPSVSLPLPLHYLAMIFPSTEMVPAMLKLRVYGSGFAGVHHEYITLMIQLFLYFGLAFAAYRIMIRRFVSNLYLKQKERGR